MPTVEELLSHKELVDYTKTRQPQRKVLEELFPSRKTEALEIKMIRGANNLPVSASIHAFDTETEIDQREGASHDTAELALIKRKRKLSEKEIIRLESPRNDAEEREAISRIYNDVDDLQDSVLTRAEAIRGEALSTGKLKEFQEKLEKQQKEADAFIEGCAKELAARLLRMVVMRTPVGDYFHKVEVVAWMQDSHDVQVVSVCPGAPFQCDKFACAAIRRSFFLSIYS